MKTVLDTVIGSESWLWLLIPLLCLALIHFGDQSGRVRNMVVGLMAAGLAAAATMAMSGS